MTELHDDRGEREVRARIRDRILGNTFLGIKGKEGDRRELERESEIAGDEAVLAYRRTHGLPLDAPLRPATLEKPSYVSMRAAPMHAADRDHKLARLRTELLSRQSIDLDLSNPESLPWFELDPLLDAASLGRSDFVDWLRAATRGEEPFSTFFSSLAAERQAKLEAEQEAKRLEAKRKQQFEAGYDERLAAADAAEAEAKRLERLFETDPSPESFVGSHVAAQRAKNARAEAVAYFTSNIGILAPGTQHISWFRP